MSRNQPPGNLGTQTPTRHAGTERRPRAPQTWLWPGRARCLQLLCGSLLLAAVLWVGLIPLVPPISPSPAYAAGESTPTDVVVVLDDSLSMAICWPMVGNDLRATGCSGGQQPPNDPSALRYSAARLMVTLADPDDRLAFVRFDVKAEAVGPDSLTRIGGRESRDQLARAIQAPPLDSFRQRGRTRIDLGLEGAANLLLSRPPNEAARPGYIIFLTDGDPTGPTGLASDTETQRASIAQTMQRLRNAGIRVFPVKLLGDCGNDCPGNFLNETMGSVDDAKNARDVVLAFSSILTRMKPRLTIVPSGTGGDVELFTRTPHGVTQLTVVSNKGGLAAVTKNDQAAPAPTVLDDGNLEVQVVESGNLGDAKWTARARAAGAFVVVRAETSPQIVYPPPVTTVDPSAVRIVPSGKSVLLVSQVEGPGLGETLYLEGKSALKPISIDKRLSFLEVSAGERRVVLQVGNDARPLQLRRTFVLEPRDGLPRAQAQKPVCVPGQPCELKVTFGPGAAVSDLGGMVFVADQVSGQEPVPVYSAPLTCDAASRSCADKAFQPQAGHVYAIRFALQARSQGVLFGDWEQATLPMRPSVLVRGLPDPLDLARQPDGGWPVTVVAGTTEDLGKLRAHLTLRHSPNGPEVEVQQPEFAVDVRGAGETPATLKIPPLRRRLPPGSYSGQLTYTIERQPSGEPVELPAPNLVTYSLSTPTARITQTSVDFGEVNWDPRPDWHLDTTKTVSVQFEDVDAPFPFTLQLENPNERACPGLKIDVDGEPRLQANDIYQLTLRLTSAGQLQPTTCTGTIAFEGPGAGYQVKAPPRVTWQTRIRQITWSLVGIQHAGSVTMGDQQLGWLGNTDDAVDLRLIIDYSGKPPFQVSVEGHAESPGGNRVGPPLLLIRQAPISHPAGAEQRYEVPLHLTLSGPVPYDNALDAALWGTTYSGTLKLSIEELDGQAKNVQVRFLNPGWAGRYVAPRAVAVADWVLGWYRGGWLLLGAPFTLCMLLFLLWLRARLRRVPPEPDPTDGGQVPGSAAGGSPPPPPTTSAVPKRPPTPGAPRLPGLPMPRVRPAPKAAAVRATVLPRAGRSAGSPARPSSGVPVRTAGGAGVAGPAKARLGAGQSNGFGVRNGGAAAATRGNAAPSPAYGDRVGARATVTKRGASSAGGAQRKPPTPATGAQKKASASTKSQRSAGGRTGAASQRKAR